MSGGRTDGTAGAALGVQGAPGRDAILGSVVASEAHDHREHEHDHALAQRGSPVDIVRRVASTTAMEGSCPPCRGVRIAPERSLVATRLLESALEVATLCIACRERERGAIRGGSFAGPMEPSEQVGASRRQELVVAQGA
jgi:hypothetical protein